MTDGLHPSLIDAAAVISEETEQVQPAPPPAETGDTADTADDSSQSPDLLSEEYIEAVTDTAFAIIDTAQTTAFKIAANIKRRKRAEAIDPENGVNRLSQIRAEKAANANKKSSVEIHDNYRGADAKLVQMDAVIDEFIAGLPFTDQQIKMMRPGLKAMVQKNAGNIPPELLFYAGLATAIGGNLAEFFTI